MKQKFLTLILVCISVLAYAQKTPPDITGNVSFISSENIYVRFSNTEGIRVGDTLFINRNNQLLPALVANSLSSISVMGKPVNGIKLEVSTELIAHRHAEVAPLEVITEKSSESVAVIDQTLKTEKEKRHSPRQRVYGRFSVSSYSNFSNDTLRYTTPNYRLRYNLALNADHISGSKVSFDSYLAYTHTLNNPNETWKDLKVYNLGLKYDFDRNTSISLGRKINVNAANIGAVDGLQFEKKLKDFSMGAIVGSRPNDFNYGYSPKLFQYGAFVSHEYRKEGTSMQTSVAFFNQTNNFNTDRRYLYLQHANSLLPKLDFFGSTEIDLYTVENNVVSNAPKLTSLYLSLNYHPINKLSMSLSYDARKNVYYYETYKNRIDSLLERAMRQGMRFRFNYRPIKYLSWGGTAGYRIPTPMSDFSLNASSYLTYARIPFIETAITLTGTYLDTNNQSGLIYGGMLSKDFLEGNLDVQLEYRREQIYSQNLIDLSFSWKLNKTMYLTTDFEIAKDDVMTTGRVFLNLTKRF
ncbi:MAG: hypothetical protein RIS29_89 [Bacteroidota bacterium]|jgi:hypothetical protein